MKYYAIHKLNNNFKQKYTYYSCEKMAFTINKNFATLFNSKDEAEAEEILLEFIKYGGNYQILSEDELLIEEIIE